MTYDLLTPMDLYWLRCNFKGYQDATGHRFYDDEDFQAFVSDGKHVPLSKKRYNVTAISISVNGSIVIRYKKDCDLKKMKKWAGKRFCESVWVIFINGYYVEGTGSVYKDAEENSEFNMSLFETFRNLAHALTVSPLFNIKQKEINNG